MVSLNYEQKHIKVNKFSRPGFKLLKVAATILHYTANNGGTADNHYSYFSNLKDRYASAHIFVDRIKALEIIPLDEVAYHANERKAGPMIPSLKATAPYYKGGNANLISIGIEMCMEKDGTIHPDTFERTILVVKMLKKKFGKQPIYRHYDVTGKNCPEPFVANRSIWNDFLSKTQKDVAGVSNNEKIMWGKTELKPGQIGKVTILKPINLWKDSTHSSGELEEVRVLNPGEEYRVYRYREDNEGQYNVGGGMWVTNMDGFIKYETPSKAMLAKLNTK